MAHSFLLWFVTLTFKQLLMSEFNTDLPSIRKVQSYTKDKNAVEIKLLTNDILEGTILWQDPNCLCLQDQNNQQILIGRHAIAFIRPK